MWTLFEGVALLQRWSVKWNVEYWNVNLVWGWEKDRKRQSTLQVLLFTSYFILLKFEMWAILLKFEMWALFELIESGRKRHSTLQDWADLRFWYLKISVQLVNTVHYYTATTSHLLLLMWTHINTLSPLVSISLLSVFLCVFLSVCVCVCVCVSLSLWTVWMYMYSTHCSSLYP